ncbi:MAG: hypothetical protein COA96_13870 [SAR86 cluster bacterium]|uniref:Uncharacterized protein n=1 Tax=SAR86 cluster bacterium TaxID=2030880 RepID=A0A2A5ATQ6_9GAMM|nr:MAG: hypothetical protein COA96_13870 [SAR86 cluster bacterium]
MKPVKTIITLVAVSLFMSSLQAHHIESDDLDIDSRTSLEGKIVDVEWINPHVIIHIEVLNDYGVKQLWLVQADTPNSLLRSGLNRQSFSAQRNVILDVYPSVSTNCAVTCLSYGISITFKDNRTLPLSRLNDISI